MEEEEQEQEKEEGMVVENKEEEKVVQQKEEQEQEEEEEEGGGGGGRRGRGGCSSADHLLHLIVYIFDEIPVVFFMITLIQLLCVCVVLRLTSRCHTKLNVNVSRLHLSHNTAHP